MEFLVGTFTPQKWGPNYLNSHILLQNLCTISQNISHKPLETYMASVLPRFFDLKKLGCPQCAYTANVNRQTADKLLFSYAIITGENV